MKKTITRGLAVSMHAVLGKMAFGHFNDADLEKMMNNFEQLGKVADSYKSLNQELHKRLFDTETEEYKKFAPKVDAAQRLNDMARIKAFAIIKEEFPEMYELLERQAKTDAKLREKEVSIELEEIDRKEFIKAIVKGRPDIEQNIFELFEPMFIVEEKKEEVKEDFSELDELLND